MFHFRSKMYSATGFNSQMQNVFAENTMAVKNYIQYSILSDPLEQVYADKLIKNQTAIGELVGFFDFQKTVIVQKFTQFMQYIFSMIPVLKYKINVKVYREKWYEQADEICKIVHSMNTWDIREFLYKQIQSIELIINSFLKKDAMAQQHHYNYLLENNKKFALILTQGIITDNKERFVQ